MPFLTKLVIESVRKTDDRVLLKPLVWHSEELVMVILVPSSFRTNFASIPSFLRGIIDNDAGYIRDAAVVHDYMYSKKFYSRKLADKCLRLGMKDLGASWFKRWVAWSAVRLFGGSYR